MMDFYKYDMDYRPIYTARPIITYHINIYLSSKFKKIITIIVFKIVPVFVPNKSNSSIDIIIK